MRLRLLEPTVRTTQPRFPVLAARFKRLGDELRIYKQRRLRARLERIAAKIEEVKAKKDIVDQVQDGQTIFRSQLKGAFSKEKFFATFHLLGKRLLIGSAICAGLSIGFRPLFFFMFSIATAAVSIITVRDIREKSDTFLKSISAFIHDKLAGLYKVQTKLEKVIKANSS